MSTNTFFVQSGSIFFISGTLEPSQSISESIVVNGDNAGTTESIVLSSTFKPQESAVGFLSLDNDFTSFFVSGSTPSSSLYFSGSGEIGFGTQDPKNEFDIKADTFKIRSRDGKKETEFRDGRFVSKKFKGGAGAETTGSQLVLSYTPGTFESPTIAQAGDILGSLTWEDLSIGNRDDATALRIQGKVDAVADGGIAIKGSMRFQIGDSRAGEPINEIAILDLTGFYISGSTRSLNSTHTVGIGMEPNGNTPDDDADRIITFKNNTSNKNWVVGVNESISKFQIHQGASLANSSPDFTIDTSGNVSIAGDITSNGNAVVSQSGAFTNNEFIVAVGDSAVTSSDALAVDSDGNLGIGTPNPEVRLHMLGEAAQTTQILMEQFNDTADAPDIRTRRYRGTSASRADVQTGDYLFRLNVHGQDGGSSELYGSMRFDVDSSDQDALEWGLQTRDTAGTVADRIKIDSSGDTIFSGNISASGNITAPSYTGQVMALDRLNYYITINSSNYFLGRNVGVESGDFDIIPTSPFSINDEQVFAANILPVSMSAIGLRSGVRVSGGGTCQIWITTGSRSDWPTADTVPLGFGASGSVTLGNGQDFATLDIPEFSINDDCDVVYVFVRSEDGDNPTVRITGQLYGRTR